jgi:sulfatase modifying factor 1
MYLKSHLPKLRRLAFAGSALFFLSFVGPDLVSPYFIQSSSSNLSLLNAPGPVLKPIEGGTFVMGGSLQEDITYSHDIQKKRVTVASFYMDETETSNKDWLYYLNWIQTNYPNDHRMYYEALPDTLVWRNPLAYNEPYIELYLRHPAFQDYPVVGVSWVQANAYCAWRTERARENGTLQQPFRLPTEAEWEYAALGLQGNLNKDIEMLETGKIYPWNGMSVRRKVKNGKEGQVLANFKIGGGNNMGLAGYLKDNGDEGDITVHVKHYLPNDVGLYNMAGNVNEWVGDVYRPLSFEDLNDFNPFRGNVFMDNQFTNPERGELQRDQYGRPVKAAAQSSRKLTWDELQQQLAQTDSTRTTAFQHDVRGILDKEQVALYGITTLINNESRVYKGGSWNDRAYWLNPAARRFMNQNESNSMTGFRTVTTNVGSPRISKRSR